MYPYSPRTTPTSRGRKRISGSARLMTPSLRSTGLLQTSKTPRALAAATGRSSSQRLVAKFPDKLLSELKLSNEATFRTSGEWCVMTGDSIVFWRLNNVNDIFIFPNSRTIATDTTSAELCTVVNVDFASDPLLSEVFVVSRRGGTILQASTGTQACQVVATVSLDEGDELVHAFAGTSRNKLVIVSLAGVVYIAVFERLSRASVERIPLPGSGLSLSGVYSYMSSFFRGRQDMNDLAGSSSELRSSTRIRQYNGKLYVLAQKNHLLTTWDLGGGGGAVRVMKSINLQPFLAELALNNVTAFSLEDFDVVGDDYLLLLLSSTSDSFSSLSISHSDRRERASSVSAQQQKPKKSNREMDTLNLIRIRLNEESQADLADGELVRIYRTPSEEGGRGPRLAASSSYPAVHVAVWPNTLLLATYPHVPHRETQTIRFDGGRIFALSSQSLTHSRSSLEEPHEQIQVPTWRIHSRDREARVIVFPQGIIDVGQSGLEPLTGTVQDPREAVLIAAVRGRKEGVLESLSTLSPEEAVEVSNELLNADAEEIWEEIWATHSDDDVGATAASRTSSLFIALSTCRAKQTQHELFVGAICTATTVPATLSESSDRGGSQTGDRNKFSLDKEAVRRIQNNRERLRALVALLGSLEGKKGEILVRVLASGNLKRSPSPDKFFSRCTEAFAIYMRCLDEFIAKKQRELQLEPGQSKPLLEALKEIEEALAPCTAAFRAIHELREGETLFGRLRMGHKPPVVDGEWLELSETTSRAISILHRIHESFRGVSGNEILTAVTAQLGEILASSGSVRGHDRNIVERIVQLGDFATARDLSLRFRVYEHLFEAMERLSGGDEQRLNAEIEDLIAREEGSVELIEQLLEWYARDFRRVARIFILPAVYADVVTRFLRQRVPSLAWIFDVRSRQYAAAHASAISEAVDKRRLAPRTLLLSVAALLEHSSSDKSEFNGKGMDVAWELEYAAICRELDSDDILPVEAAVDQLVRRGAEAGDEVTSVHFLGKAIEVLSFNRDSVAECLRHIGSVWKAVVRKDIASGALAMRTDGRQAGLENTLLYILGSEFFENDQLTYILDGTFDGETEAAVTAVLTEVNSVRNARNSEIHAHSKFQDSKASQELLSDVQYN